MNNLQAASDKIAKTSIRAPNDGTYGNPNSTFWSRMSGKDEGAMNKAVSAGTATPDQAAAHAQVQQNLSDPRVNNPFDTALGPLASAASRAPGVITDVAPTTLRSVGNAVSGAASKAGGAVSSALGGIRGMFSKAPAAGEALVPGAAPAAEAAAGPAMSASREVVPYVAPAIKNTLPSTIRQVAGAMPQTVAANVASTHTSADPTAQATPAPGANAGNVGMTAQQKWLVDNGVPLDDQSLDAQSLRGSGPANSGGNAADFSKRAAVNTVDGGRAVNLGAYGGSGNIYGTSTNMGGGKINNFVGVGTSDGAKGDRMQREMSAQKIADMNHTSALQKEVAGLRTADADRGAMNFGSGGGGRKSIERMNAETAQDSVRVNEENSIRSNDTARWQGERQLSQNLRQMQWDRKKHDDEFGHKQEQDTFANKQANEKSLNDQILQAHTTTGPDGKDVVDNAGANATRLGLDTMIARQIQDLKHSGSPKDLARAQNLSENGIHAMSPDDKANGIAAVKLMAKVNAASSNLNPFKPDPLASSDPRDYMNMKKNADGDYVTGKGQVIPARFMHKKESDFFLGQPTNEFDGLRARK